MITATDMPAAITTLLLFAGSDDVGVEVRTVDNKECVY